MPYMSKEDWPTGPTGDYDGLQLLSLVRQNRNPFQAAWDVEILIREIEDVLKTQVIDIPRIDTGSNNYGLHLKTSNTPDLLARLANSDVNMPGWDGWPLEKQVRDVRFEAAVYELLRSQPKIRNSHLLYHRVPQQYPGPHLVVPPDLKGRRLFVFERAEGAKNWWNDSSPNAQFLLLDQMAHIRAALFSYNPPLSFASDHLHSRIFDFMPKKLAMPVALTRAFWIHVLQSKIQATIRNEGDMIAWPSDEVTVGPVAFAAKQSLLRAIPWIMPEETKDTPFLYRFVLEHGDFGIHNASITLDANGDPLVTSIYDWETGCIVPALLSDPQVSIHVDLTVGDDGEPRVTRLWKNDTDEELQTYASWAHHYIHKLYQDAPDYQTVIKAGKDVRYLWFALRDWRGDDSEDFFGNLGAWAERRMQDLGAPSVESLPKVHTQLQA